MKLVFLFGPPASGKLTIAREVAAATGLALFHNHLVVDAVASVFPFGSEAFVELREAFWLATFGRAAREGRSLIFTFAPEPTVAPDFPVRVQRTVEDAGGEAILVRLVLSPEEQARRIANADRAAFGKLRSPDLLSTLGPSLAACEAAMPPALLTIDTAATSSGEAARRIVEALGLEPVGRG